MIRADDPGGESHGEAMTAETQQATRPPAPVGSDGESVEARPVDEADEMAAARARRRKARRAQGVRLATDVDPAAADNEPDRRPGIRSQARPRYRHPGTGDATKLLIGVVYGVCLTCLIGGGIWYYVESSRIDPLWSKRAFENDLVIVRGSDAPEAEHLHSQGRVTALAVTVNEVLSVDTGEMYLVFADPEMVVDFTRTELVQVDDETKDILFRLPPIEIEDVELDLPRTRIYDSTGNDWKEMTPDQRARFEAFRPAAERLIASTVEQEQIERAALARKNAVSLLVSMYKPLGWRVAVEWTPAPGAAPTPPVPGPTVPGGDPAPASDGPPSTSAAPARPRQP